MSANSESKLSFNQPEGLWILATLSALLCIGFGAINSQLVLYTSQFFHFKADKFYPLSSTYNALLFTLPLVGGFLASKTGYRRSMLLGMGCCTLALILVSIQNILSLYAGLAFFSVGTALFVPSNLVLIGHLFSKTDSRRDSGFTLSYVANNFGFLLATLVGAYLTRDLGHTNTFLLCAAFMLMGFVVYGLGRHRLPERKAHAIAGQLQQTRAVLWAVLGVSSIVVLVLAFWLLTHTNETSYMMGFLIILVTIGVVRIAWRQESTLARNRILAFLALSYLSIAFWALYSLEPSLLNIFINDNVNRIPFSGARPIPAAAFYSLDPIFVIGLGFVMSWIWKVLEQKNASPSIPSKYANSLLLMGLGILVIPFAIWLTAHGVKIHFAWIILTYFFLSLAELFIAPIGQAMVGKLCPESMEGLFMGAWQLFTGFAGAISVYLDQLAQIPSKVSVDNSNQLYSHAFLKIGITTMIVGVFAVLLVPYIRKLITSGQSKNQVI